MKRTVFAAASIVLAFFAIGWRSPTEFGDFPLPCSPESWTKHGVILESSNPNQQYGFQNFNSPAEPLGDGRWRIWFGSWGEVKSYTSGMNIGFAEGVPGQEMTRHFAVLSEGEPADAPLSIGNLPAGWRPVQPVHIRLKNGRRRLYFWAHGRKDRVIRYLAAESDDGRRFKVLDPHRPVLWHFSDRAVEFAGTTPTGLKLPGKSEQLRRLFPRPEMEPAANPELVGNDGATLYQLDDGSFEMYASGLATLEKGDPRHAANDNLAGYVRNVDRLISKDGLNFSGRKTVIQRDPVHDPIDQQFYYLNVTHTPKGRVGMLGHYRVKDQTMDLEWCFSRDGVHWIRPFRQRPWLERGWPGEPDALCIYSGTTLVQDAGKWWLFYTGCNYTHNMKHTYGSPNSVIMCATTQSIWK